MINANMMSELKPLISDPAWKILVDRLEYIKAQSDTALHNAKTFEEFLEARGGFKMAEKILRLFKEPKMLADDGVCKIPGLTNEA